jgi:hypothetical protein
LRLAGAPDAYSKADQQAMRATLTAEDKLNHKRGQDLELAAGRLIMTDTATGDRRVISLTGGVLVVGPVLP